MSDTTHSEAVEKLAELIKDIGVAMMTTVRADGTLHSRPMATQQEAFDGELWFFTGASSSKIDEIEHDQHVLLNYASPADNRYVVATGTAAIVQDKEKARELWSPAYKAWFPDGLDDPNLALLKVDVEHAEYWDSPSSSMIHLIGFVKALVTGKSYDPGEYEKIDL